jgi:hypothetical protein
MAVSRTYVGLLIAAVGCGSEGIRDARVASEPLPLTDACRLEPAVTPLSEPQYPSLIDPEVRNTLLQKGYGDWEEAPGEPCVDKQPWAAAPKRGPNARRLLRFAHLTDINIVDDESPARAVNADQPATYTNAFRPHETELCRMANAMVGTLNRVHAREPLELVLLGGNLIDNAQQNELDWALQILNGADKVECDSGDDNDLVPGVDDGKDPFEASGLDMPFYWVTGNHDILMQGGLPTTGPYAQFPIGELPYPSFALRDFSDPAGPLSMGPTRADERRAFLSRPELLQRIAADGDGHGLSDEQARSGKAFYSFDIDGTPLRFVVLDTAGESGGVEGLVRSGDIDEHVRPLLDKARDDKKWVVLAAHHPVMSLSDGTSFNGNVQMDALTSAQWLAVLGEYDNILFSLHGHERADHAEQHVFDDGHAFWELTSAPLGSYPHQARVIELWDEDNGYVALEAIYVDMDMRGDPVAEQGRHLGVMDYASGWNPQFATGITRDRNLRVYAKTP